MILRYEDAVAIKCRATFYKSKKEESKLFICPKVAGGFSVNLWGGLFLCREGIYQDDIVKLARND